MSLRILQQDDEAGIKMQQFLICIFWFILLLSCCVVPAICWTYRCRFRRSAVVTQCPEKEDDNARRRKIEKALKSTTIIVSSRNLSDLDQESPDDKETVETQSDDGESNFLFLIGNHLNASRHVPAYCIICFCAYEIGDPVSFSSNINCCHAFHKECIESWLIKEPQSLCPCCRNEFCEATTKTPPTSMAQEV